MISGEKFIFFGGNDWFYHTTQSNVLFTKIFAKSNNECLYVNPIPVRMPKIGRSGSLTRYKNKLYSLLRYFRKVDDRTWVLSPFFIPCFNNKTVQFINTCLIRLQLMICLLFLGWTRKKLIIFAGTPAAALCLSGLKRKVLIYYLSDKYDKFRGIKDGDIISKLDNEMAQQADIIIACSKAIHDHYKNIYPNCHYISHGVDFDLFHQAVSNEYEMPDELKNIGYPIIGYWGTITESNDKEILSYIAQNRSDWNIVLIGQVVSDYSSLEKFPNIHFLGKKKLQELPNYGKYFDVCIMNWIMNEWMHYCSPMKAKDYLAMGKPVVSVPIPEVKDTLGDVISIAATPQEFLEKIEWEILNDCPESINKRIAKVSEETWESKVEEISNLIRPYLK